MSRHAAQDLAVLALAVAALVLYGARMISATLTIVIGATLLFVTIADIGRARRR